MNTKDLFKLAGDSKASDIHLLFGQEPIFRIDGKLFKASEFSKDYSGKLGRVELETFAKEMLNRNEWTDFLDKKDFDMAFEAGVYRFRVNFAFEKGNIVIVARVIDDKKPSLEEIGMPEVVERLLELPQGFILVTGPTGCGKSTTMAAMIEHINKTRGVNIITLEDPIEYVFTSDKSIIAQRQLGTDMVTFAEGLKHILRQDPNVIMVGEMRDLETIATAVTLAETGHLVLATLHTYSAAQTIDRVIDIFPPHQQGQIKSQLSSVLTAVISQRLLPRIKGGRIAAREILLNNPAISNLIREGKIAQIKSTIETNSAIGMVTMDRHIKQLYAAGEITRDAALAQMEDTALLDK